MKKWTLMEKFETQGNKTKELRTKYQDRMFDAAAKAEELKVQYEAKIKEEIATGADLTTEKEKLRIDIRDAEQNVELSKREHQLMLEHNDKESLDFVTVKDLLRDYQGKYRPAVFEEEIKPLIEKLNEASAMYFQVLVDLKKVELNYAPLRSELTDMALKQGGETAYPNNIFEWNELPLITIQDAHQVQDTGKAPVKGGK
jgi:hypothetical protein